MLCLVARNPPSTPLQAPGFEYCCATVLFVWCLEFLLARSISPIQEGPEGAVWSACAGGIVETRLPNLSSIPALIAPCSMPLYSLQRHLYRRMACFSAETALASRTSRTLTELAPSTLSALVIR